MAKELRIATLSALNDIGGVLELCLLCAGVVLYEIPCNSFLLVKDAVSIDGTSEFCINFPRFSRVDASRSKPKNTYID